MSVYASAEKGELVDFIVQFPVRKLLVIQGHWRGTA
jgi:hypothetical protein